MQMLLALIQGLWDHAEPTGYSAPHQPTIRSRTRPPSGLDAGGGRRSPGHDPRRPRHGARAVGAAHLDTGIREVWGLETVSDQNQGSTYVEYSFGLPAVPVENVPNSACDDPHGKLRQLDEAREQLDHFFQTGIVQNFCTDGVCDFPDMSGC